VQLEKQVKEVEQFYQSNDNSLQNPPTGSKMQMKRASEEIQNELMRHFSKILTEASASTYAIFIYFCFHLPFIESCDILQKPISDAFSFSQITRHEWAWPFMEPVDVEGLGLHDYYQVFYLYF
jgi:hypothetical protein